MKCKDCGKRRAALCRHGICLDCPCKACKVLHQRVKSPWKKVKGDDGLLPGVRETGMSGIR